LNTFNILRLIVVVPLLLLLLGAQRYWFRRLWRFAIRIKSPVVRRLVRGLAISGFSLVAIALLAIFFSGRPDLVWRLSGFMGAVGLWVITAFVSWVVIRFVSGVDGIWRLARRPFVRAPDASRPAAPSPDPSAPSVGDRVRLDRRRFVQAAGALAGAIPFGAGAYGFLIGRHDYRVHEINLPISGLPRALDGLRIAQLSDIHIGSYMSAAEVRRAVGLANDLRPDLSVVTGDFITGPNDPLGICIAELARLRAPLGVWGCAGNHEIYADAEEEAAGLFAGHGMKLLRQENAEINWRGGKCNLIGVDYQLGRDRNGRRLTMLADTSTLVRRDVPNILLSHNPNSFPRAAELDIELTLAGHTHGGQVRVEILDDRFSPAQFLTSYVAGLYRRPLGCSSAIEDQELASLALSAPASLLYVNRGLGTIGAPMRIGVPPEISLFTLRRA